MSGELVLSEQDGRHCSAHQTGQAHVGQVQVVRLVAGESGGWTLLRSTGTAPDLISATACRRRGTMKQPSPRRVQSSSGCVELSSL
jgi:hypothetical protein